MPVTPITPLMPPVIVVTNSSPKKSEAEIMKENGGHVFFSVHLKHCAECREAMVLRERERHEDGIILLSAFGGIVIFFVLLFGWHDIKDWFRDRIEAYKVRKYPLYRFEGEATTLQDPDDDSFHFINQVNYLTPGWSELFLKLPIIVRDEKVPISELFKTHKEFLYHATGPDSGCTYYLFKRWSIDGWKHKVLRLPNSFHNRVLDKLKNL